MEPCTTSIYVFTAIHLFAGFLIVMGAVLGTLLGMKWILKESADNADVTDIYLWR